MVINGDKIIVSTLLTRVLICVIQRIEQRTQSRKSLLPAERSVYEYTEVYPEIN